MSKILLRGTQVRTLEMGYVPVETIRRSDKIFILDEKSRCGWVDCWFEPEMDVFSGSIYYIFMRDLFDELLIQRRYECAITFCGGSNCIVRFGDDIQLMSVEKLFNLVDVCHRGKGHMLGLYSWGSSIRNRNEYDELVTVPVEYFKTRKENVDFMEVCLLSVPDEIGLCVKQEGNTIFI